jgi:hypothetical protein
MRIRWTALAAIGAAALAPVAGADVVTDWAMTSLDCVRTHGGGPGDITRALAIESAAVYDAVVAIDRNYSPIHATANPPLGTSREAAAVTAAYHGLLASYPELAGMLSTRYAASLAPMPDGAAKTHGIVLGEDIAQQIVAWRASDHYTDTPPPYTAAPGPGVWEPTPPLFAAPYGTGIRNYTPWIIPDAAQFVATIPAPPGLASQAYADSYNEVISVGALNSTTRTADQTQIAIFWANDRNGTYKPPGQWIDIARILSGHFNFTVSQNARLLAQMNCGMADACIVCWSVKYINNHWRPITAIRRGDTDGNPNTVPDAAWQPLADQLPAPNTPPFPAYTSGHSTFGGVSARVMQRSFGTDAVPFDCGTDENATWVRHFTTLTQAAEENAFSRVYLGVHWRYDCSYGLASGYAVADWVMDHGLQATCRADYNGDGAITIIDFLNYLSGFAANDPRADLNADGVVNLQDFLAFLAAYSAGCA